MRGYFRILHFLDRRVIGPKILLSKRIMIRVYKFCINIFHIKKDVRKGHMFCLLKVVYLEKPIICLLSVLTFTPLKQGIIVLNDCSTHIDLPFLFLTKGVYVRINPLSETSVPRDLLSEQYFRWNLSFPVSCSVVGTELVPWSLSLSRGLDWYIE